MERMSIDEYRALLKKSKSSKYGAVKTVLDGHKFDSKAEANFYSELKLLQKAGEVTDIELQPAFVLLEAQKGIPGIKYIADFRVTYSDGRQEVIDVKGHRTSTYRTKVKWFRSRYPDINFREVQA